MDEAIPTGIHTIQKAHGIIQEFAKPGKVSKSLMHKVRRGSIVVGIASKAELEFYLSRDLKAAVPPLERWRPWFAINRPILAWQRLYRKTEYWVNCQRHPVSLPMRTWMRFRLKRRSMRLGFDIPVNVFGPGLSIAHWGTITVDGKARIGADCRIHQGVTIGSNGGSPTLGDRVFIGANAVIIGPIVIGDDTAIGALSLVNKSFEGGQMLVGVPARARGGKAAAPNPEAAHETAEDIT